MSLVLESKQKTTKLSSANELIYEISQGRMVVLLDDEDRENEGDLVMAANKVDAASINFMASQARGLICMPISKKRAEQLNLTPMVKDNNAAHATNFTVSIEASCGVSTGISCADRAHTILEASKDDASRHNIVSPGHIFPLIAQDGGVLSRAGHTEAAVDLVKLAGLGESGVIVEILNEDGTMARRPELEIFAQKHGLKIGTIADLIHYRLHNQQTVQSVGHTTIETEYASFVCHVYKDQIEGQTHLALVKGDITPDKVCSVRVHTLDLMSDVLGSLSAKNIGWTIERVQKELSKVDSGVLLLLGKPINMDELLAAAENKTIKQDVDYRQVGVGSQILKDLGVSKMRLLSSAKRYYALSGFGLEIEEIVNYS